MVRNFNPHLLVRVLPVHRHPSLSRSPHHCLCAQGTTIVIDGHNASLGQYLWSGRTGSYYEIPGGWPGWKGDVVAKEFYIWFWPHELARELKYLSRVRDSLDILRYIFYQS
jgi:hypothetical protein